VIDSQAVLHGGLYQVFYFVHLSLGIGTQPRDDSFVFRKTQIMDLQIEALKRLIPAEYPLRGCFPVRNNVSRHPCLSVYQRVHGRDDSTGVLATPRCSHRFLQNRIVHENSELS
jgi:hypothetical protein